MWLQVDNLADSSSHVPVCISWVSVNDDKSVEGFEFQNCYAETSQLGHKNALGMRTEIKMPH